MNILKNKAPDFFRYVLTTFIVCAMLINAGCKRTLKNEEFFGPEYMPAPEGFYVESDALNASTVNVNFGVSEVIFSSSLSHVVTWTITITGAQSGAVKQITSLSDNINADNATWKGGSSNIYFFKKGEVATAVLSFLGTDLSYS